MSIYYLKRKLLNSAKVPVVGLLTISYFLNRPVTMKANHFRLGLIQCSKLLSYLRTSCFLKAKPKSKGHCNNLCWKCNYLSSQCSLSKCSYPGTVSECVVSYQIYSADHCVNPVGNREEYTFYELFKDYLGRFYGTQETIQDHFCAGFI